MKSRFLSIVLAAFLLLSLSSSAFANTSVTETASDGSGQYNSDALAALLAKEIKIPEDDTLDFELDWLMFTLSLPEYRSLLTDDNAYPSYVERCVNAASELKLSDITRWLLALRSYSSEQTDIAKRLLETLLAWDFALEQDTNPIAYALLSLDAYKAGGDDIRNELQGILSQAQHGDGGYNYLLKIDSENEYSISSDPDSTAVVLTALAPYRDKQSMETLIQKGLTYLKSAQLENGGFGMFGESAESTAQVIIALCTLGIDPKSVNWSKNGKNPVDSMESFRLENHAVKGWDGKANTTAGEQVLRADTALNRFSNPNNSLYLFDNDSQQSPIKSSPYLLIVVLTIGGGILFIALIVVVLRRRQK